MASPGGVIKSKLDEARISKIFLEIHEWFSYIESQGHRDSSRGITQDGMKELLRSRFKPPLKPEETELILRTWTAKKVDAAGTMRYYASTSTMLQTEGGLSTNDSTFRNSVILSSSRTSPPGLSTTSPSASVGTSRILGASPFAGTTPSLSASKRRGGGGGEPTGLEGLWRLKLRFDEVKLSAEARGVGARQPASGGWTAEVCVVASSGTKEQVNECEVGCKGGDGVVEMNVDDALHDLVLATIRQSHLPPGQIASDGHSLIIPVDALTDTQFPKHCSGTWHPLAGGVGSVHITCAVSPFSLDDEEDPVELPDYSPSNTAASPPTVHRRERLFEGGGGEANSPRGGHGAASQDGEVDEGEAMALLEGMSIGENGEGEEDFAGVPRSLRGGGGGGGEGHEVLIAAMEDLCEELKLAREAFVMEGRDGEALLMGHVHRLHNQLRAAWVRERQLEEKYEQQARSLAAQQEAHPALISSEAVIYQTLADALGPVNAKKLSEQLLLSSNPPPAREAHSIAISPNQSGRGSTMNASGQRSRSTSPAKSSSLRPFSTHNQSPGVQQTVHEAKDTNSSSQRRVSITLPHGMEKGRGQSTGLNVPSPRSILQSHANSDFPRPNAHPNHAAANTTAQGKGAGSATRHDSMEKKRQAAVPSAAPEAKPGPRLKVDVVSLRGFLPPGGGATALQGGDVAWFVCVVMGRRKFDTRGVRAAGGGRDGEVVRLDETFEFPIAADTSDKSMLSATLFVRVPGHRDEPVGVALIPLSKVKMSDHRVMHDWFSLAPPARGNANNRPPPIMPGRGTTQVRLLLKLED